MNKNGKGSLAVFHLSFSSPLHFFLKFGKISEEKSYKKERVAVFGFFKRKKQQGYRPQFEHELVEENFIEEAEEPIEENPYADVQPGEVIEAKAGDGEMTRLEDGREFPASFVREVRAARAEDLKIIIEEQGELYSPEEFAYIREVFAERLGD